MRRKESRRRHQSIGRPGHRVPAGGARRRQRGWRSVHCFWKGRRSATQSCPGGGGEGWSSLQSPLRSGRFWHSPQLCRPYLIAPTRARLPPPGCFFKERVFPSPLISIWRFSLEAPRGFRRSVQVPSSDALPVAFCPAKDKDTSDPGLAFPRIGNSIPCWSTILLP